MPTFELWGENNEGAQKSSSLSTLLLSSGGRWRPETKMIYEWDSISFLFALPCILERLERRRSQSGRNTRVSGRETFCIGKLPKDLLQARILVGNGTELSALKGEKSLTKLTAPALSSDCAIGGREGESASQTSFSSSPLSGSHLS